MVMALIKCSECGREVSDKASTCPNCGNPIKSKNSFNLKKPILSIVVLLFVLGGGYAAWQLIGSNGKDKDIEITDALSKSVRKYDALTNFHEGFAAVIKDGKWGYINSDGEEIIPCKYDGSSPFSEGLACVYVGDENLSIEFIDKKGNTVIKGYCGFAMNGGMTYAPITFKNGICCVSDDKHNDIWIDKQGNIVDEPQIVDEEFPSDDTERFDEDGKVGVKDTLGNVLIKAKYSYVDSFSEGLALAYLHCGDKTIFGYVDKKGNDTFTESDFAQLAKHEKQRQEEAKRAEEERKRQEEEAKLQGQEIIISMSADIDGTEFKNKQCNIGEVSTFWDQIISKRMKVRDGKVLIFKYHELNRHNSHLDWVGVDVYDKNGNAKHYETNSCGEFAIFEGETFRTRISLSVGNRGNHLDAKFHFREKDKDLY